MVKGIGKFKEYFSDFEDNYIIIGGTACDILEEKAGQQPRATKDIDIILVVEALTAGFVERFWEFIKEGEYTTREKGNGKHEYFRFLKPGKNDFPSQIELFSKNPDMMEISPDAELTPIPVDEDLSSLSAILMNEEYYNFTLTHSDIESEVHIANIESLIVLKAKAFNDLSNRKEKGATIDSKNITKHKNDVFRLVTMLSEADNYPLPPRYSS
jgi:predicted nucleotidyltransferase